MLQGFADLLVPTRKYLSPLYPLDAEEPPMWRSLPLQAAAAASAPGFGTGIKFLEVAPPDTEVLRNFIRTMGSGG